MVRTAAPAKQSGLDRQRDGLMRLLARRSANLTKGTKNPDLKLSIAQTLKTTGGIGKWLKEATRRK